MDRGAISREDILKTLHEHDELGREAFLDLYHYGKAQTYVVIHDGKEYDSKAVAGVAHKHGHGRPLTNKELSGGLGHAVDWLRREGFVVRSSRNPKWTEEELILACDVVARNGWHGLSAEDPRIGELSHLLQLLGAYPEAERAETYRNCNGAARKTYDIATHHPDYKGSPTNGGKLDVEVLTRFLALPERMAAAAERIREGLLAGTLESPPAIDSSDDDEEEFSAPEGRALYRKHRRRERSKKLRAKKIAAVLKAGGTLACEACAFDFGEVYGERGEGYVEVHHVVPLHVAGEGKTKLSDLALICSNCHRMIHRSAPWPTPAELRVLVEQTRSLREPLPGLRTAPVGAASHRPRTDGS